MRMWIQNISDRKQYVECYHNWWPITPCTIDKWEIVEVNSPEWVINSPKDFKEVDKPVSRFLHPIAILVYWAIIDEVIRLVLPILLK